MRDAVTVSKDGLYAAEIRHPLSKKDAAAVAALRIQVAAAKGAMSGANAPGPDDTLELVPDAAGVTYAPGAVGGISGVWCLPKSASRQAIILYLHGGGYVAGSAYAYRHFVGNIAALVGITAFVADYRLAPEHAFPAAIEDAEAAYRGLVADGFRSIAIVGDSAGGGLALTLLAVAQAAVNDHVGIAPSAAIAMSPWTDLTLSGSSFEDRAQDDPLVTKDMLATFATEYLAGHDPQDPLASPLYAKPSTLTRIRLHVGTSEVLLDDARRYVQRFRDAGCDAVVHSWEGMMHVFPTSVGTLEASDAAVAMMSTFLKQKLGSSAE